MIEYQCTCGEGFALIEEISAHILLWKSPEHTWANPSVDNHPLLHPTEPATILDSPQKPQAHLPKMSALPSLLEEQEMQRAIQHLEEAIKICRARLSSLKEARKAQQVAQMERQGKIRKLAKIDPIAELAKELGLSVAEIQAFLSERSDE
jgi:hypothetical protein